jgi:transposase
MIAMRMPRRVRSVLGGDKREYPIRRDESGKSARRRAFELFDEGLQSAEVAQATGISRRTAYRYCSDWNGQEKNLEMRYRLVRRMYQRSRGFSDEMVKGLSKYFGWSEEEVVARLAKPWAIKQLVMGKWEKVRKREAQSQMEARLDLALRLAGVLERYGVKRVEILGLFERVVIESRKLTREDTAQ